MNHNADLTVTIAIPTYNEENYIESVIKTFINQEYPSLVEVLVADGGSTDKTQDIVKKLSLQDPRIKLIINLDKIQSAALNLMLSEAKGNIFLRADAHCEYSPDYIKKCVEALLSSDAVNIGGAQRFIAKNKFQVAVSLASRSFFGSGGAKYRNMTYDGYANTVFLGCFWKEALYTVANKHYENGKVIYKAYDTSQITNEDAELNQRLLDQFHQAIYISSEIKVWYFPRDSWKGLWTQYFKYGRGRYLTASKHPSHKKANFRGKIPFIFFCFLAIFLILDFCIINIDLYSPYLILIGIVIVFLESVLINIKSMNNVKKEIWKGELEEAPFLLSNILLTFIVLVTLPIAQCSGYAYQLLLTIKENFSKMIITKI